ncbi:exocyst subunit, partial [Dimargaris xerosporica]
MAHPYGAGDRPLQRAECALYEIEVSWEFMTHEDFNPVALALQLMDGTLPGRSYSEFTQYFHKLDDSLTDIVDEYYQGFNNSILSFSEIKDKLADTQHSIQQVQESIQTTHQSLAHDKSALGQLYYKVTQHTEMIRVLDQIEALKAISEEIEELTSKKQYLLAVEKLLEGLKVINSPEMRQVGALTDLRAQVTKEKNEIHEVIIEELHNHVYLKSPYCERKMALAYDDDASGGLGKSGGADALAKGGKRGQRTAKPVEDEDNPEVNSFDYVEMLIQSLVLLGRIDDSVTRIQERIPVELNHLTNRVITEVEERHRIGTESEAPLANGAANTASVTTTVAITKPPLTGQQRLQDQEVLEDFVSTLYVRFGSVLEYHRFVLEVIGRVSKRQSGQGRPALTTRGLSPTYALREVWLSIQSEIKSMLYDYLTTDTKVAQDSDTSTSPLSAAMGNPTASPSAPLSIGGSLLGRDRSARRGSTSLRNQGARWLEEWNLIKNRAATSPGSPSAVGSPDNRNSLIEGKQVFSFSQSEMKATSEALYKPIGDDVRQLLNGLHPESATQRATNSTAVDRFADSDNSARHPMLVTPSIYHASVVLTPTIRFLSKIGHVLLESRDTQEFDEFLRHFFVRFFLPQVEAYAMQLFHQITVGTDAFYNHPTLMFRGRPVVKSAVAIVPLIHDLSGMLSAIPFYREEYVMIIEKLIRKYFEECQTRFREAAACSKGHPSATHSFKNALTASTVSLPPLPTDEPMPDVPLLSSSQHPHHNANQQCISARWAKDDDLLQLLDMKLRLLLHEHDVTYDPHADRELEIEYRLKHDRSIHPSELMFDVKKMNFLATLYHSLEWFLLNV